MLKLQDLPYQQYPNPRFRREDFVMLNGEWDFSFADNSQFHPFSGQAKGPQRNSATALDKGRRPAQ